MIKPIDMCGRLGLSTFENELANKVNEIISYLNLKEIEFESMAEAAVDPRTKNDIPTKEQKMKTLLHEIFYCSKVTLTTDLRRRVIDILRE